MGPAFYIPLLCVNSTAADIGWRVDIDLACGENLLGGTVLEWEVFVAYGRLTRFSLRILRC